MKKIILAFFLFFFVFTSYSADNNTSKTQIRHGLGVKYDGLNHPVLSFDYNLRIHCSKSTVFDLNLDALSLLSYKIGLNEFGYINLYTSFLYAKPLGNFSFFAGPSLKFVNQFYSIKNHQSFDEKGNQIKELPKAEPFQFSAVASVAVGAEYSFGRKFIARGVFNLPFAFFSFKESHFTYPTIYHILPAVSLNYYF